MDVKVGDTVTYRALLSGRICSHKVIEVIETEPWSTPHIVTEHGIVFSCQILKARPASGAAEGEVMQRAATISSCSRYRYSLRRTWADGGQTVCFIMLNPSTADAEIDDPTIRRCIGFGKAWHFDALEVVNLFALRATKPVALLAASDPIGPDNDEAILQAADRASLIVCAWGAEPLAVDRAKPICALLNRHPLYCVGTTKSCRPKHPLYIRGDQQPVLWTPPTTDEGAR